MEIQFFKPKKSKGGCKLTVHKTGKLGLSSEATKLLLDECLQ